ncbi:MAG: GlsB/YeaQ/YmgE family stress response membrane protein [Ignavibacterium sp.]|jgi:uncharacterized membrane protein YeaQ/YmgE (transglycosylase-associated protein family)|nr:GlsB/YeaQ/YmgE family stress response membrane protein [Parabacteroides sp.]MBP9583437.1 GlsB/YeaQ/YmgE family stress response membrane protein [Ignavibacterium sp.]
MELGIIGSIVIGILAGFIAGQITKGRGFGLIVNLIVGLIGAVLGGFLFNSLGIDSNGTLGMLVVSVIGAVVFLSVLSLFGGLRNKY